LALAQDKGSVTAKPLPPLANPDDPKNPAKELFGRKPTPTNMQARSIGFYARGCLAGGVALPINGKTWQVMRLSRNRNWGHPELIAFMERLAEKVPRVSNWPGLLVGDMTQPRGGPMLTGHGSHQVGLDADIWLTPMPKTPLSREEREEMSATMVVAPNRLDVDPKVWSHEGQFAVIKAAAEDPKVERIFVNAAIKKALCREAGKDRAFLHKVRPWWGHDYHFHVRIVCQPGSPECKGQEPQGPRLVVPRLGHSSRAAQGAGETEAAGHDGRSARNLPAGSARAVAIAPEHCCPSRPVGGMRRRTV
jgi:penicillin-insensitive murein endopeptidase